METNNPFTSTKRQLVKNLSGEDIDYAIFSQLSPANYLLSNSETTKANQADKIYHSNEVLWADIINESLFSGTVIHLGEIHLSEWFPRSPGLFFTDEAKDHRRAAQHFRVSTTTDDYSDKEDSTTVYNTRGKALMLKGGVGCFRFKNKEIEKTSVWLLSATSSKNAHEGFPVAIPDDLFSKYYESIRRDGYLMCSLSGRLKFFSGELCNLYKDYIGVPQLYLFVEQIIPVKSQATQKDELFKATGGILFNSHFEGYPNIYASYVTFYPGKKNSIRENAEWLQETYVEGMYKGEVLTDFDEQMQRFANATFSLEKVMKVSNLDHELLNQVDQLSYVSSGFPRSRQQIVIIQKVNQLTQIERMEGGNINYNSNS